MVEAGRDGKYFNELFVLIRDIHSAGKVFLCKMLDIYAIYREKGLSAFMVKGTFSCKI